MDLTLEEFTERMKLEVTEFRQNWEDENKLDPEGWPMRMSEEDWFKQIIACLTR